MNPPCFCLDFEATGVSPTQDKPVQACLVSRQSGTDRILMNTLVNPCRTIDPGATAVHGITDAMVRFAPDYAWVAWQISQIVAQGEAGRFMVSFNGSNYDIPMLDMCLGRPGVTIPQVDVLRFARRHFAELRGSQGGKKLGELYEIFLGRSLVGAHDAAVDVLATLDLLEAMQERAQVGLAELAEEQSQPRAWPIMAIGKYIGLPVAEVPRSWAAFMSTRQDLDPDLRATVNAILAR